MEWFVRETGSRGREGGGGEVLGRKREGGKLGREGDLTRRCERCREGKKKRCGEWIDDELELVPRGVALVTLLQSKETKNSQRDSPVEGDRLCIGRHWMSK